MKRDRGEYSPEKSGQERRRAERIGADLDLMLGHEFQEGWYMTNTGHVEDISLFGARLTTNRKLEPGQRVEFAIPTEGSPRQMGLPGKLTGSAIVRWVKSCQDNLHQVALSFAPALSESMEFEFFMVYLQGLQLRETAAAGRA
jgi:hypothetical protein